MRLWLKQKMGKVFLVFVIALSVLKVSAQKAYAPGDVVKDFTANKILNYKSSSARLQNLKAEITLLDFFGTWCVPCIKALPHLKALQQKFPGKLEILLISIEEQARLDKFLKARQPFPFPLIVDTDNSITSLFNPPSYPYTVVMDEKNKIITIADAANITEADVQGWLAGKSNTPDSTPDPMIKKSEPIATIMNNNTPSSNPLVALSQRFMYAAKTGDDTKAMVDDMAALTIDGLVAGLKDDAEKKAFWINAYNGFTQVLLKKNPDAYKDRKKFFTGKQIMLAGKQFSLDDIEHGILRRSKTKWSLGYFNELFPGNMEKALRVKKLDYRIHFALNCGAKSCPPIAFYSSSDIDRQLSLATASYLNGEGVYNEKENSLGLPAIMGWFRRDFGGKNKMLQLVKSLGIVPEQAKPRIYFNEYDWQLALDNYIK